MTQGLKVNTYPAHISEDMKKEPRYCSEDGNELYEYTKTFDQGYDPYTGLKLPDRENIYLRCRDDAHVGYLRVVSLGGEVAWQRWWL